MYYLRKDGHLSSYLEGVYLPIYSLISEYDLSLSYLGGDGHPPAYLGGDGHTSTCPSYLSWGGGRPPTYLLRDGNHTHYF